MSGSLFQGQPVPPQPTGSDTTSTYPLWLQQYQANLANAATNLSNSSYSQFPGALVAQPSGATQQAWNMAQNSIGNYQPALNAAVNYTGAAGTPITGQQIGNYLNPYTSNVVGALQQSANTNLMQNQMPAIQSQFVGAGQAASPQHEQAANNALYQSNQALDQATSSALQSGYQGAVQTALQEQQAQQAAGAQMGQLGALTQQLGAAQTGELSAAGNAQDVYNQNNINAALNQFTQQQQWPYQNLAYAADIIRGQNVPSNTQTVGMNYSPGQTYTASPLSSFIGTSLGSNALLGGTSTNLAGTGTGVTASLRKKGGSVKAAGALSSFARAA